MSGEITADPEVIQKIQSHMLEKLDEYLKENPSSEIDVFMFAHNFHRYIADDMARRWERMTPRNHTLRMADLTFRAAMRALRD